MSEETLPVFRVTVIVPTLNEAENIETVSTEVFDDIDGSRVIVADDGSKDGTHEIVNEMSKTRPIVLLDRSDEQIHGITISVVDAVRTLDDADSIFAVMDGDGQHDHRIIEQMVNALEAGSDVAVGTRKSVPDWPFVRRLISWGATTLGKLRLFFWRKSRCKDLMSGYFAMRRDTFLEVYDKKPSRFTPKGYKILFDFLKAGPRGLKIAQPEYVFGLRGGDTSKIGKAVIWQFLRSLFR